MRIRWDAWSVGRLIARASCALCLLFGTGASVASAAEELSAIETKARNVILIDLNSRTVLFEQEAEAKIPPASMVKLMTLAVLFKAIDDGETTLDTTYSISEHAWRTGGAPSGTATMFAELNSQVRVEDLIRGIIIQSANDACIAVAEGLAGSEEAFAERMNALGREIGLKQSTFGNPTGLPDTKTRMSASDLARLATHLIDNYPAFYTIFSETAFTWNGIFQRNRNPLFANGIGADGLKTGYTEEAGYGMVASAIQEGRRLLLVIAGLQTQKEREREALRLLRFGYSDFHNVTLFEADEDIGAARVYGGTQSRVPLFAKGPVVATMPMEGRDAYRLRIVYDGPVEAPVADGQRVGTLNLYRNKRLVQMTPLYAGEDIDVGLLHQRAFDAAGELLFGRW